MGWFSKKSAPVEVKSELTDPDSTSWQSLVDWFTPNSTGVTVTADSAMRVPAVNAGVSLPSETVRMLSCKLYRKTAEGKEEATDHPAVPLVNGAANEWQSAGQVRQQVMIDAILHGDGFAYVGKVGGRPTEILHLPREMLSIEWDNWNKPTYRVGAQEYATDEIIHVQSPSIHGRRGLGLLAAGREAIGLAILLERAAARLFKNNARPGGVLTFKGQLTPKAMGNIAQSWKAAHGGDSSGGTAVIDNDGTYVPVAFTSVDSQHAEQRNFAINEISRLTRVPATMLSDLSRGTFSNTEQLNLQFRQQCILPWTSAWVDAYCRTLLTKEERSEYSFEFMTDELVRADTAARATAISQFRAAGVMTSNDARRLENLPPLPGGDELQNPFTTSGAKPANDNQPPKESAA